LTIKAPSPRAPRPPASLSTPARKFWSTIRDEYDIRDSGGLAILTAAAEAFHRVTAAEEVVAREGMLVEDRYGIKKPHPCTGIARDARSQLLTALRQLNLDLEPLQPRIGRPAGLPAKLRIV
jgi:phage terminase small subunit